MNTKNDLSEVDFSIIRYANSWEDGDILLEGLQLKEHSTILSIASGGDNVLALLTTNPKYLLAVDVSKVQLYLTELKICAFKALDYINLLEFIGVRNCSADARLQYYKQVQHLLSAEAKIYWDSHVREVQNGVIHFGKFEDYFRKFRTWFLPLVHRKHTIKILLEQKTDEEQKEFYEKNWNNLRWQFLIKIFFSKMVMGRQGRDPQFLKHVNIPVGQYILNKTEAALQSAAIHENYFLHYILTGNFGVHLPVYLRPENFEIIKANLGKIELRQQDMDETVSGKNFEACYCSNIFEYISEEAFAELVNNWRSCLPAGCKLAFWNLMNDRSFAENDPENFGQQKALSNVLTAKDKGFFYRRFLAEYRL